MLPIEKGLLLLLRVAFCKSYPENLYSLFFLQTSKKGKTLLTFFLADEKEFNITFLFAKERCQNPIFTFFCRATKESETKEKCLCPRFAKLAMHLLRFRERWTHEHLENCFFKKKAVVKLFLLSFSTMRKKVSKERIAFVIYPQANSTSCLRKYGRYVGFYQPSFRERLRSNIAGYPLIKSSSAQRQYQQCLRTLNPSPIDYESLLIKVKAFLLSFNFFYFYLHQTSPLVCYINKLRRFFCSFWCNPILGLHQIKGKNPLEPLCDFVFILRLVIKN